MAKAGGSVAGKARKDLEKKSGTKIISNQNFKDLNENENESLIK